MNTRLENIPVFETRKSRVSATHFNLAAIALKRIDGSIRIPLPGLRTLELIIESDAWIVIDTRLNEIPVLAWLEFDTHERALHEDVPCRLNLYHQYGPIILKKVLEAMALIVGERLSEIGGVDSADVTPLDPARQAED